MRTTIKVECVICGNIVERTPSRLKRSIFTVCSKSCFGKKMIEIYKENKIERKCEECGTTFFVSKAIANKNGCGRFCSISCKSTWLTRKTKGVRRKQNNIINKGSHFEMIIKNKKGVFTILFDTEDLDLVNQYTWFMGNNGYARAHIPDSRKMILMHRLILNTPEDIDTDHFNHNTYDNRKNNLRICTTSQNMVNIHIKQDKKYKGVYVSRHGRFYAKNANKYLGTFATPELAAQKYNDVVKNKYGDFAQLNKI